MARYVDGFILPVPKKNAEAYRRMARMAGKVWRDHGALEYIECIADDAGKLTSFPQSVTEPGETVCLGRLQVAPTATGQCGREGSLAHMNPNRCLTPSA
jgi:uncharacterized protein YbaA (DUF1428 family)